MKVVLDFETRSRVDLRRCGTYVYAMDPSTEVLCLALKVDEEETAVWFPPQFRQIAGYPELTDEELIKTLHYAGTISAHNAQFERLICQFVLPKHLPNCPVIPLEKWRCTAAMAAALALPRNLDGVCEALNLSQKKDVEGSKAMMTMCKPDRNGNWVEDTKIFGVVIDYCMQDVAAEYELEKSIAPLSDFELDVWRLDQRINDTGIALDVAAIPTLQQLVAEEKVKLNAEVAALTDSEMASANQAKEAVQWLMRNGVPEKLLTNEKGKLSIAKHIILELVKNPGMSEKVKRFLEIRQLVSLTSTAKLQAMVRSVCPDGRLRGAFMYHGASTGRWSGRHVQPQNFVRGCFADEDDIDLVLMGAKEGSDISNVSKCLRGMLIGDSLNCADYSAIEGRVLAWLACEEEVLDHYRNGRDMYKVSAAVIYGVDYEAVDKPQRQIGKVCELALGYQGWVGAFHAMGRVYNVHLVSDEEKPALLDWYETPGRMVKTRGKKRDEVIWRPVKEVMATPELYIQAIADDRAKKIIKPWRENRWRTVDLWAGLNQAATQAILNRGDIFKFGRIAFKVVNNFLKMRLPSGRCLSYYDPEIQTRRIRYSKDQEPVNREVITFMGVSSIAGRGKKWERQSTYGGKLTENAVQAISRDILVHHMLQIDLLEYPIVLHVHDEPVAESANENCLETMLAIMKNPPPWAKGLPIEAAGWVGKRYKKE